MTEDRGICDLEVVSLQDSEPEADMEGGESPVCHPRKTDSKQPEVSANHPVNEGTDNVDTSGHAIALTSTNNPKSETDSSLIMDCVDHHADLDWFCSSEGKLICCHCAIVGSCQGHTVTPLATQASTVRVSGVLIVLLNEVLIL